MYEELKDDDEEVYLMLDNLTLLCDIVDSSGDLNHFFRCLQKKVSLMGAHFTLVLTIFSFFI